MTLRSALFYWSLVVLGVSVSGLTISTRSEDGSAMASHRIEEDTGQAGSSRSRRFANVAVRLRDRSYTYVVAEQVQTGAANSVNRRDESPADSTSPVLRNLPLITIGGALLIVFIVAALVIWFKGRKYKSIEEPAPEGMQEVPVDSSMRTGPMKVLKTSQGPVTPPRQDSLETPQYKDVLRRKLEAGDLMPSRKQQRSAEASSLRQNVAPPQPTEVPKLPPPTMSTSASSRPLPMPDPAITFRPPMPSARTSPSPTPSADTPPLRAMSKTPPIPKITVPEGKPLPNPYALRDSRVGSVILTTPADDHFLPNPYADSMDGHSPARADTPEPFQSVGPVQPLRVAKKNSTSLVSATRSSTFDMGLNSRNSNLYTLPVLDISHESLSLSLKSAESRSSHKPLRTETR